MTHIERIAAHRPYGLDCKCGRPINSNQDWAQHFAEALGLTEETQERPVFNGQPCTCNRPDGKHYGMGCDIRRTDWIPHTRLVGRWEPTQGGEK